MGQLVGGVIGIFILYSLWEFALFKRICNDPVAGKVLSVVAAYATAVIGSGFGMADGGPWTPVGLIIYAPGAVIVAILAVRRGMKLRDQQPEFSETFE